MRSWRPLLAWGANDSIVSGAFLAGRGPGTLNRYTAELHGAKKQISPIAVLVGPALRRWTWSPVVAGISYLSLNIGLLATLYEGEDTRAPNICLLSGAYGRKAHVERASTSSSPVKGKSMAGYQQNRKSFFLQTPPLLRSESAEEFNAFCENLNDEIKPQGPIERMYADEFAYICWDILRFRRAKAIMIDVGSRRALERLLQQIESKPAVGRWQEARRPQCLSTWIEREGGPKRGTDEPAGGTRPRDCRQIARPTHLRMGSYCRCSRAGRRPREMDQSIADPSRLRARGTRCSSNQRPRQHPPIPSLTSKACTPSAARPISCPGSNARSRTRAINRSNQTISAAALETRPLRATGRSATRRSSSCFDKMLEKRRSRPVVLSNWTDLAKRTQFSGGKAMAWGGASRAESADLNWSLTPAGVPGAPHDGPPVPAELSSESTSCPRHLPKRVRSPFARFV
jgi:hypothetical protein